MKNPKEIIINNISLDVILNNHLHWLKEDPNNCENMRANLRYADLRYADLSNANLSNADLRYADLSNANLSNANLSNANLSNVFYNEATSFFALQCPEEGSFIAYKKARSFKGDVIVKLLVTENAKRSSSTTRKCRCSEAKVLSFYDCSHNELSNDTFVWSSYDKSFIYKIGEIVKPITPFDDNRWNECSAGIHFFITFDEAKNY